jgi:hypothetical protein
LLDDRRILRVLNQPNVLKAIGFIFVSFARVGDDAAVGGFQTPTPFPFVIFVVNVGHESFLSFQVVSGFKFERANPTTRGLSNAGFAQKVGLSVRKADE